MTFRCRWHGGDGGPLANSSRNDRSPQLAIHGPASEVATEQLPP